MAEPDDNNRKEIQALFGRHLVGFTWHESQTDSGGEPIGDAKLRIASGFILEVFGEWWLVTAGHVFTEYKKKKKKGIVAVEPRLYDIFGDPDNRDPPLVFDFFSNSVFRIVEYDRSAGLDFALIQIPPLETQALSKTITPFRRADWCHEQGKEYERYFMIGLPTELSSDEIFLSGEEAMRRIGLSMVVLKVDRICEAEAKVNIAKHSQFVGRLAGDAIENIVGMSGGPIIGLRHDDDGRLRYYPVAVQSRWIPHQRITIGSLVEVIGSLTEAVFQELFKRQEESEDHDARNF